MAGTTFTATVARADTARGSLNEAAASEWNTKFHIDYDDIDDDAATGSTDMILVTLGSTPAKWIVNNAYAKITTAFAGTTALTVVVGTTTSENAFITSQTVKTAGTLLGVAAGTPVQATASVSLVARFTNGTGGSPSDLSAGAMDIYLNILDQSRDLA